MFFKFRINQSFHRKLPDTAKTVTKTKEIELDPKKYADCLTTKQLREYVEMDCSDSSSMKDKTSRKSVDIVFYKAYFQNLILGGTTAINEIERQGESAESQLHDLKLTFSCPDRW